MVQDIIIRHLFTPSFSFLIFFVLQQLYWRAMLRGASKSTADLPGGERAFNLHMLLQAVVYAYTLAIGMMPFSLRGYDWSNWELWRNVAIAWACAMVLSLEVISLSRRIWPSLKAIDLALAELVKARRREKQAAK